MSCNCGNSACLVCGPELSRELGEARESGKLEVGQMLVEAHREIDDLRAQVARLGQLQECHAQKDGECEWEHCPQLRDDEPNRSGRHCPLDYDEDLRAQVAALEGEVEASDKAGKLLMEAINEKLDQRQSIRPLVRAVLEIHRLKLAIERDSRDGGMKPAGQTLDLQRDLSRAERMLGKLLDALPDDVREWAGEGE